MKVLFLDIDGVLNDTRYIFSADGRGASHIDPARVARLNRVVRDTGAAVVVSSAWRIIHGLGDLRWFLASKGFVGMVRGVTPNDHTGHRGTQIQAWLDATEDDVEAYAVVDDSHDAGEGHAAKFVQTVDGIEDEHVEKLVRVLGEVTSGAGT